MARLLPATREEAWDLAMRAEDHPFVDRIRAERAIVRAVNRCRGVVGVELAGTSEKAIAEWFVRIPFQVRRGEDVVVLRRKLVEASRDMRLGSNASHRGAMVAERVRREVADDAIDAIEQVIADMLRAAQGANVGR